MRVLIKRRQLIAGAVLGAAALAFGGIPPAWADHDTRAKPRIRRSEAKPIIMEQVEEMARSAKENLGYDYTQEEKEALVEAILRDMEAQEAYVFWDP